MAERVSAAERQRKKETKGKKKENSKRNYTQLIAGGKKTKKNLFKGDGRPTPTKKKLVTLALVQCNTCFIPDSEKGTFDWD